MVTTINAYSVSLGMDASKYLSASGLSRSETRQLAKDIDAARTPAENYQRAIDRLTSAKEKGGIQTGVFNRLIDEEKRKLDAATASVVKHENSMGTMATQVKGLVAGYVGLQTVTKAVNLAIDAEQAAAQFEVMTGSLNNSKFLMQQIQEFAAKSPVSLKGAQDAAKTMLGFGLAAKDVATNLKMLGDISGGNQQRFDSLTLAFSQMSAAGRLMGQDVLQMVNAGFNPLQQISQTTGESMVELKKRMEAGGISADEVTAAFRAATEEGGRFHGMTEKMAETMGGKLSIAMADLDMALTKVGQSLSPLIISLTDGAKEGTSAIDGVTKAIGTMSDGLGYAIALTRDLSGMTTLAGLMTDKDGKAFGNTTKFLDLLEKRKQELANPKTTGFDELAAAIEDPDKSWLDSVQEAAKEEEKLRLERDKKENLATQDRIAKEEKRRVEMLERLSHDALRAADEHFKKERENARKLRDDIAKGPTSMEAGSADAARYLADQANAAIAASMVGGAGLPTEEQMLAEAQRQSEMLTAANDLQVKQVDILQKLLEKKPDIARAR